MANKTLDEIAALPFFRGNNTDHQEPGAFDCAYAVNIWDAQQRLALNKMIEAEPDKPHTSPDGLMHYVPNAAFTRNLETK